MAKKTILEFLKGENSPKILEYGLNQAQYFGKLNENEIKDIEAGFKLALFEGFIETSADLYPTVRLAHKSKDLIVNPVKAFNFQRSSKIADQLLLNRLQVLRNDLASRENIQRENFIDDKSLEKLAIKMPQTMHELEKISGLNQSALNKYAVLFLGTIKDYVAKEIDNDEDKYEINSQTLELISLAKEGKSLEEIAKLTQKDSADISIEIENALNNNFDIDGQTIVNEDLIDECIGILRLKPKTNLRDMKKKTTHTADFPTLRIAAALARAELKKLME